jgi:hypothetical protein
LYRDIQEFKNGYQRRTNIVKDKNGDLVAASPQYFGHGEEIISLR